MLVETGYDSGVASLVCLRDGTTSLYFSGGGGIIGGGAHQAVVRANAELFTVAQTYLAALMPSSDRRLPAKGRVVIRALTYSGKLTFEASEDDLGNGRSSLSPVFHSAHGVITQLRLIDEQAN